MSDILEFLLELLVSVIDLADLVDVFRFWRFTLAVSLSVGAAASLNWLLGPTGLSWAVIAVLVAIGIATGVAWECVTRRPS